MTTVDNVYFVDQDLDMNKRLENYVSVAQGIARLFHPHAEVIIHDLASGNISHIFNAFSQRRVGDSSMTEIDDQVSLDEDVSGPYKKVNFDRRQLRSVTSVLRDDEGNSIGLLCINYDVTVMVGMAELAASFLNAETTVDKPRALFAGDFKESSHAILDSFLSARQITLAALSAEETVLLIGEMDEGGVFAMRNATNYVCELLSLSRATVYKYLRRARAASD